MIRLLVQHANGTKSVYRLNDGHKCDCGLMCIFVVLKLFSFSIIIRNFRAQI